MSKIGEFKDLTDQEVIDLIVKEFCVEESTVKEYEIIACALNSYGYEEDAYLVLKKDNEFYEVNASHCSCHGFETQFEPKISSLTYILSDHYGSDEEIQKYIKEKFYN